MSNHVRGDGGEQCGQRCRLAQKAVVWHSRHARQRLQRGAECDGFADGRRVAGQASKAKLGQRASGELTLIVVAEPANDSPVVHMVRPQKRHQHINVQQINVVVENPALTLRRGRAQRLPDQTPVRPWRARVQASRSRRLRATVATFAVGRRAPR